jgi:hypothetical protein
MYVFFSYKIINRHKVNVILLSVAGLISLVLVLNIFYFLPRQKISIATFGVGFFFLVLLAGILAMKIKCTLCKYPVLLIKCTTADTDVNIPMRFALPEECPNCGRPWNV